jgi:hypothetical protein
MALRKLDRDALLKWKTFYKTFRPSEKRLSFVKVRRMGSPVLFLNLATVR